MKNLFAIFILIHELNTIIQAQTVTIGTQVWMTKNLDVATFRNGDPIPQAKTDEEWYRAAVRRQPAWCYYDNDPANGAKYGKLYNWYAVNDSRGLAPVGYHIPCDEEWAELTNFLGGEKVAGIKMKSKIGWNSYTFEEENIACPKCKNWNEEYRRKVPCHNCQDTRSVHGPKVTNSGNGTNTSGFSGLPGGLRSYGGTFYTIGKFGYWWSTTEKNTNAAWDHYLYYGSGSVSRGSSDKQGGVSVRCLRD